MDSIALNLGTGGPSLVGALVLAAIMIGAGVLGGVLGGLFLGAKDLGAGLAAMMGGFYGPLAAIPAAAILSAVAVLST